MEFNFSLQANNRASALYPYFYEASEKLSKKYILISPARFLFDAGLTPKDWNKKMLEDEHLKVEYYNPKSSDVFVNTDIKGGVAIIYRDSEQKFGAIGEFIPDDIKRKIASHFKNIISLSTIMYGGRSDLKFNNLFFRKIPKF